MKHKLLADDAGERTFILALDEGDEAFGCMTASRTFDHDTPFARRASDHLPLCADLEIA